jgi:hypothetical protein
MQSVTFSALDAMLYHFVPVLFQIDGTWNGLVLHTWRISSGY